MKIRNQKSPEIPEELKPISISFKTAFWVVLAIHILIGASFAASPVIAAKAKENKKQLEEDRKVLDEPLYVGIAEATPTPAPVLVSTPKVTSESNWPRAKEQPIKKVNTLTKEYVVMPGDTFYSIVRRYKLNPIKLQKLNKITDVNKLAVGQHLKFL